MCIDAREALGWWTLDPLAVGPIAISSFVYGAGLHRIWRSAGVGHGIRRWEAAAFYAGQLTLVIGLLSPVDRLSDIVFSAHMTQHEILMVVAPPLVVLGRPFTALGWLWPRAARALARPISPAWTVAAHAVVIWLWHIPALFEAALRSEAVHVVQHAMFFGSAALFWWSVVRGGRAGYGLATLFVFATATHTSILGLLLTMAGRVWYPLYAARGARFGIDAVDDQALAGIVMWIPAGVALTLVAMALFAVWLGESARRVAAAERRRAS